MLFPNKFIFYVLSLEFISRNDPEKLEQMNLKFGDGDDFEV